MANAELVVGLHHVEVALDGIRALEVEDNRKLALALRPLHIRERVDQHILVGVGEEIRTFAGDSLDRIYQTVSISSDSERNQRAAVRSSAFERSALYFRAVLPSPGHRHVPHMCVLVELRSFFRHVPFDHGILPRLTIGRASPKPPHTDFARLRAAGAARLLSNEPKSTPSARYMNRSVAQRSIAELIGSELQMPGASPVKRPAASSASLSRYLAACRTEVRENGCGRIAMWRGHGIERLS